MSRAIVKELDTDYREELPERPVSEHPNDVTAAGLAQIEHALAAASEAYAAAQASADRAALAAAGRDLRYWSARRATARVVPAPIDRSEVRFGASVTILRDDGREQTFRIVGEDEAGDRNARDLSLPRGVRFGCRRHQPAESRYDAAPHRHLWARRRRTGLRDRGRSQSIHEGSAKLLRRDATILTAPLTH
jgi:transcription elongation GreA/GreB family factor